MSTAFEPNELHTVRGTQHAARCVYATSAGHNVALVANYAKRERGRRENESVAGIKRHKGALKVRHSQSEREEKVTRVREREREKGRDTLSWQKL